MNMMIGAFPRNEDGSIKRKQPCQEEGCNWPNWHICPKRMGEDTTPHLVGRLFTKDRVRTQAHRDSLREAARDRWDKVWAAEATRDKQLIDMYVNENRSYDSLMQIFDISKYKVQSILKRAAARGEVVIRREGSNIRWEQRV